MINYGKYKISCLNMSQQTNLLEIINVAAVKKFKLRKMQTSHKHKAFCATRATYRAGKKIPTKLRA